MNQSEQRINELQQKITRKMELEDRIPELEAKIRELTPEVLVLEQIRKEEQQDVDRLESGGLGAMFHKLTGTMEQKLEKERQEASVAVINYTTAAEELAELENQLANAQSELEELRDAPAQYRQTMDDKIKSLEGQLQAEQSEDQIARLNALILIEKKRKSLREALLYAELALNISEKNLSSLADTRNSIRDGLPEDQGQEKLGHAVYYAEKLLEHLTNLQAKMAQMGIDPQPHLSVCGYLRAPAAYIIGIDADTTHLDRISLAIEQIHDTQAQIQAISEKMNQALSAVEEMLTKTD